MISGLIRFAASHMSWMSGTQLSRVFAVSAPIVPPVVSPMCGTRTSAPAPAIASASPTSKTYGAVEEILLARKPDQVDLEAVAHPGLLEVRPERALEQPDRGEVLDAAEPDAA